MRIRIFALLLALVALSACGKKDKRPDDQLATARAPVFLAAVPADTPYVFAGVEPMPLGPMFQWIEAWSSVLGENTEALEAAIDDEYTDPGTKALAALIVEMTNNMSREGFERLGFSVAPRFALYGIGVLPAFKIDVADEEKVRALIQRVESRSGLKPTAEKVGEREFWTYEWGGDGFLAMALSDGQLTVGYTPRSAAKAYIGYLVGAERPEKSLETDDKLSRIAKVWGFKRFGVGYVDLARFAQIIVDPQPGLNDTIFKAVEPEPETFSEVCRSEMMRLVGYAPRVVFGYEDWSVSAATFGAALELSGPLGKELAAARTPAPLAKAPVLESSALYVTAGFDVGKVIGAVRTRAVELRDNPFQCDQLASLNQTAGEVAVASTAFVSPMISNIRGVTAAVTNLRTQATAGPSAQVPPDPQVNPDDVGPYGGEPMNDVRIEGFVSVATADPVSLFDFLKSTQQELSELAVQPDGVPVAVPAVQGFEMLEEAKLVMTPQTLTLTSGEGVIETVAPELETQDTAKGPFLAIGYDFRKLAEQFGDDPDVASLLKTFWGQTVLAIEPRDSGIYMQAKISMQPRQP